MSELTVESDSSSSGDVLGKRVRRKRAIERQNAKEGKVRRASSDNGLEQKRKQQSLDHNKNEKRRSSDTKCEAPKKKSHRCEPRKESNRSGKSNETEDCRPSSDGGRSQRLSSEPRSSKYSGSGPPPSGEDDKCEVEDAHHHHHRHHRVYHHRHYKKGTTEPGPVVKKIVKNKTNKKKGNITLADHATSISRVLPCPPTEEKEKKPQTEQQTQSDLNPADSYNLDDNSNYQEEHVEERNNYDYPREKRSLKSNDQCPFCGNGILRKKFTWSGIIAAIILFPCGGICCCFKSRVLVCTNCGLSPV